MIRIRYADLPEGMHVQAVAQGTHTVIYLRPGLTPEERRDSLRRARQSARMGHGPRLPATELAVALADDAVRGTTRNLTAAVRGHPLGSLALVAAMGVGAVCYVLLVTVSMRFIAPPSSGFPPPRVPHQAAPFALGHDPHRSQRAAARWVSGPQSHGDPRATGTPSPRGRRRTQRPSPSPSPDPTPDPAPSTAQPSPSATATPRPSKSHKPHPSHSPSPKPTETCLVILCG